MIIIDIIVISLLLVQSNPDESVSIVAIYIIPLIFILNVVVAGIFLFINRRISIFVLINSIVAPVIFFILFAGWFKYKHWEQYKDYHYTCNNEKYELSIHKKTNEFDVCQLISNGSIGVCYGYYKKINDTIYFNDTISSHNIHHFYMTKDSLFEFPNKKYRIKLN